MGGERRAGADGTFEVDDPATTAVIATVANGDVADATAAVDAAAAAFPEWSSTSPRQRSDVLRRAYEAMLDDKDRLVELISAENGKSRADAAGEVVYAAEFFRWFSEEAVRHDGAYAEAPAGGVRNLVTHKPVGVAALVTPWNFPAAMATRKLAPALAAGCTMVLKPAAETPLTALAVSDLLHEAGVPAGAVNLVPTLDAAGVVSTWLSDERVRKISFTGSTGVGRVLLRQAADRVVNASMELGGNAPFVVADDADLAAAADGAIIAKFRNAGQACTAANRFYVHESVAEQFLEELTARTAKLRVGPAETGADLGPMITRRAADRVEAAVEQAVAEGATVRFRGERPDAEGYFVPPVILGDVAPEAKIVADEIFGPVAPVVVWRTEQELLEMTNATEYGLAAYVFSRDLQRAIRIAERLDAGMIGVNRGLVSDPSAPFGGVKQSGLGREGAREGLKEFQETQYLSVGW
nr:MULTISPECIES: NAD-dependent succinate-semialdehyde dehydrogenase [unclassified Nocardioides]